MEKYPQYFPLDSLEGFHEKSLGLFMKKFLKGLLRNPRRSSTNELQKNCSKSSFESWEKTGKKIDGPEFMNLQPKLIKYHIMNYEVIFTIFELSVTGSDRASNSQIWNLISVS